MTTRPLFTASAIAPAECPPCLVIYYRQESGALYPVTAYGEHELDDAQEEMAANETAKPGRYCLVRCVVTGGVG